ncbi:hypothetical protein BN59_02618 [Legionella massiliensis]|uniref:Uncharacterized protein n=1 Tax=Legionella massiliensis TaxID=1034943 RepID=A0A078L2R0_9GAMM|nr:hypothetical protein [Legionella massiliensis]CDZ78308.1 hypothetical protein BN59_02618 [Legionella massiliensis]CEE14046.1 hypothetical protein BN1094_02618 [Legionella massiliensis]
MGKKERRLPNESIEPMLSSCSNLVSCMCQEESCRLSELLSLLNDFRPCLKFEKSTELLIVELLDWDGLAKTQASNFKTTALEFSRRSEANL